MSDERKPGAGGLLNGQSLTHLTGARSRARTEVEVQLPAKSLAEVIDNVSRLGRTGNLTINFSSGRAMDMTWKTRRETDVPEGSV
jgi:hypothetical protein